MSDQLRPPFVLIDVQSGDVLRVSGSLTYVLGSIEVPEVQQGAYTLLDSVGRTASLRVDRWDVVISSWAEESQEDLIREALSSFLLSRGLSAQNQATLDDLAQIALAVSEVERIDSTHPAFLRPILRWRKRLEQRKTG